MRDIERGVYVIYVDTARATIMKIIPLMAAEKDQELVATG